MQLRDLANEELRDAYLQGFIDSALVIAFEVMLRQEGVDPKVIEAVKEQVKMEITQVAEVHILERAVVGDG